MFKSSILYAERVSEDSAAGDPTKGEQTRRAVLTAAIERFGRDGFRSTAVTDIARDAGVGATVPYAYFANKETLFLAALDDDAAGVIHEGLSGLLEGAETPTHWRESLIVTLVEALDRHPLARRILSGLEPDVTERVIEIPAMLELRKAVTERLRSDQAAGLVRSDIDPESVGNGAVTVILSLLMSVLQFGGGAVARYGPDIWALFGAALDPADEPVDGPDPAPT